MRCSRKGRSLYFDRVFEHETSVCCCPELIKTFRWEKRRHKLLEHIVLKISATFHSESLTEVAELPICERRLLGPLYCPFGITFWSIYRLCARLLSPCKSFQVHITIAASTHTNNVDISSLSANRTRRERRACSLEPRRVCRNARAVSDVRFTGVYRTLYIGFAGFVNNRYKARGCLTDIPGPTGILLLFRLEPATTIIISGRVCLKATDYIHPFVPLTVW